MENSQWAEQVAGAREYVTQTSKNFIPTNGMSRERWLLMRQAGIGSSDAAGVLGVSEWNKTPYKVWLTKTRPPQDGGFSEYQQKKMKAGLAMEGAIAELFEQHEDVLPHEIVTRHDKKIRIHPKHRFMLANLDRRLSSPASKGNPGLYEIKNVGGQSFKHWDGIPVDYWCQVQHQFLVTGYEWGYFGALVDGWDLHVWEVRPDTEYQQDVMIPAYQSFWDHVLANQEPPSVDAEDVELKHPKHEVNKYLPGTPDMARLQTRYWEIKGQIGELNGELDAIKQDIQMTMGDAEGIKIGSTVLCTWKQQQQARIDSKRLKAEKPEIAAEYVKQVSFRKFDMKRIKSQD